MSARKKRLKSKIFFLAALGLGNILLLTVQGSILRITGAMILLLLPGYTWAEAFVQGSDRWARLAIGFGLSYVLAVLAGLLLDYIPGGTPLWMILLTLNLLSLGGIAGQQWKKGGKVSLPHPSGRVLLLLAMILVAGAVLRFYGLEYSEFQSDEIKPLISAAESLAGNENALFVNRKKGPGEILIPMMLWPMTGTMSEWIARLPFALAGVLAILTLYLVTERLLNSKMIGLVAATLLALNGFMLAFSRIVQYQTPVIWLSLLALLCAWEWRATERARWGALAAAFIGVGILFHYDTVLVTPALAYLVLSNPQFVRANLKPLLAAAAIGVTIVAMFLLPFTTNPQATSTAGYVGGRIGSNLINNQLYDFFHYTSFFNSFYYLLFTGSLVLGYLAWATVSTRGFRQLGGGRYWLAGMLVVSIIIVSLFPNALYLAGLDIDLAFLPFTLILVGALLSPRVSLGEQTVIVWFATTFLGYCFIVSDPRTHFYTVSPAWAMLAAIAAVWLWQKLAGGHRYVPVVASIILVGLFSGYLYIAFLRQDVEFRSDWPESQIAPYWSPYAEVPRHHFGFVRNIGWKAIGGLYATGQLDGRFDTNSGSGLYRWYSRKVLWGCTCCSPKEYFLAFGYENISDDALDNHQLVGRLVLARNGREVAIYQVEPAIDQIESPEEMVLYRTFDKTATPGAFVWPRGEPVTMTVNLADLFDLAGYEIILPRPQPVEEMAVVLRWQRGKNYQPINFNVLVQLADAEGNVWGQSDSPPVCGQQPTSAWPDDETITDAHLIQIDPHTPPGEYEVFVAMYLPNENFYLPVLDDAGQPTAEWVRLGTVTLE